MVLFIAGYSGGSLYGIFRGPLGLLAPCTFPIAVVHATAAGSERNTHSDYEADSPHGRQDPGGRRYDYLAEAVGSLLRTTTAVQQVWDVARGTGKFATSSA